MSETKQPASTSLHYFIAEKNSVVIISWIGRFQHESIKTIEECQSQILKTKAKWVIMNFRDLKPNVDRSVVPVLAKLNKTIREIPAVLRLSSMHPQLTAFLSEQGLLRPEEVVPNLAEAIQGLVKAST